MNNLFCLKQNSLKYLRFSSAILFLSCFHTIYLIVSQKFISKLIHLFPFIFLAGMLCFFVFIIFNVCLLCWQQNHIFQLKYFNFIACSLYGSIQKLNKNNQHLFSISFVCFPFGSIFLELKNIVITFYIFTANECDNL